MERLFVDTSAWFALANRSDVDHDRVAEVLHQFEGRLITSNHVFDETVTLCRYRLGHDVAIRVGQELRDGDGVDQIRATADDEAAAWALFVAREDKSYSFTDCTSFILMRRLGLTRAAALDEDFRREGFETVPTPDR
jgi:predicted nucleic acid-binding protein